MQGSDIRQVEVAESSAAPAPASRWARRAAGLTVLTTLPSAIWRTSMALGVPVGADGPYVTEHYGSLGWGTVYVIGLSLVLVGLASLTLGLVRPWGEIAPRWMPVIGGKRVRPLAAVIPAGAGAVALTLLWCAVFTGIDEIFSVYGLDGAERVVIFICYAPMLLWGPLLGAVTVSYAKRCGVGRATRVVPSRRPSAALTTSGAADPVIDVPQPTEAGSAAREMATLATARTIGAASSEVAAAPSRTPVTGWR